MSKPWLRSDNSRRRPASLAMALFEVALLCCSCAKIAGFQDFAVDPAGTGANSQGGFDIPVGGDGQTTVNAGGTASGGTNSTMAGGSVARGGGTTGTSSAPCGQLNQRCCTGNVCNAASTSCNPTSSNCEACGAIDGPCCPSTAPCTGGGCCGVTRTCVATGKACGGGVTCNAGHCSNCGQASQTCCGDVCEFGSECTGTPTPACQNCGDERQSCCNNGGFPLCKSGLVCSGTSVITGVCSATCGASNQPCCTITGTSGSFCELASGRACTNNVCK
jgi:hypothetical protein